MPGSQLSLVYGFRGIIDHHADLLHQGDLVLELVALLLHMHVFVGRLKRRFAGKAHDVHARIVVLGRAWAGSVLGGYMSNSLLRHHGESAPVFQHGG